jgi:7-cyano-7-deazaguanine tRNA-ribosyltransferase
LFEVRDTDLAGRLGRLTVAGKTVETPAFLPVVHPVRQEVPTAKLKEMGFGAVITNSYITRKRYGDEAVRRGIHEVIGYDGIVMTDSGGYQALMYGGVDVDPVAMAEYQRDIGSDIAVILDLPTGYPASRARALHTVRETIGAAKKTLPLLSSKPPLWVGPVQGGAHLDLVGRSARAMAALPFDIFAIGSPVEVMNGYDFEVLSSIVIAAKRALPQELPVHLFGAAHPLTIPMAVALGCDLFDSASYILFAKQDRYMTPYGVRHLSEMSYLACSCPVCASHTITSLTSLPQPKRTEALALHNLYVLKAEVDSCKEALKEGRLWELATLKARSHPRLFGAARTIAAAGDLLLGGTPVSKPKALFLFDRLDFDRPELLRFREGVRRRWSPRGDALVILLVSHTSERFFVMVPRLLELAAVHGFSLAVFRPFFGLVPLELYCDYPASQCVMPEAADEDVIDRSVSEARKLVSAGKFSKVTLVYDGDRTLAARLAKACGASMLKIQEKYYAELKRHAPRLSVH